MHETKITKHFIKHTFKFVAIDTNHHKILKPLQAKLQRWFLQCNLIFTQLNSFLNCNTMRVNCEEYVHYRGFIDFLIIYKIKHARRQTHKTRYWTDFSFEKCAIHMPLLSVHSWEDLIIQLFTSRKLLGKPQGRVLSTRMICILFLVNYP